jgi:hypothetical protein
MESPEAFIEQYRVVFERFSAPEIATQFAFPLHVTGETGAGVSITVAASAEQWTPVLDGLLAGYRALGVTRSEVRSLEVTALGPSLAQARVHWALLDGKGQPIYDFHSVYTLGRLDDRLRVVAIAHDELPKLRGALARRATGTGAP